MDSFPCPQLLHFPEFNLLNMVNSRHIYGPLSFCINGFDYTWFIRVTIMLLFQYYYGIWRCFLWCNCVCVTLDLFISRISWQKWKRQATFHVFFLVSSFIKFIWCIFWDTNEDWKHRVGFSFFIYPHCIQFSAIILKKILLPMQCFLTDHCFKSPVEQIH